MLRTRGTHPDSESALRLKQGLLLSWMVLPNRQLFWIVNSTKRRARVLLIRASAARCVVGRHERTISGLVTADMFGTPSTRAECAPPASTSGLRPNVCRAAVGRRIRIGMHSDALTNGSKLHNAAKGGTTDYARANRRVSDLQPRGRQRSAVWYPARQRSAQATRSRQWSVQRPSVTISNRTTQRSIRSGIARDP